MQKEQVLLRTDNFYLFAGIGPIVEGYIIIAPHTCDRRRGGLQTISEASPDLLDELIFLRGIITRFFREVYGFEGGLFFEHGRAGTCGVSDTLHCYHAHLCCFPVSEAIWEDIEIPGNRVQQISGLVELGAKVGKKPHLLFQDCHINRRFHPETAGREWWETRVVVLDDETSIPRQYLRKLLAERIGLPDLWDWAAAPKIRDVKLLCMKFRAWLKNKSQLPVLWRNDTAPYIRFLDGVRSANSKAYDSIAHEFHCKWGNPAASMVGVMAEFANLINQSCMVSGNDVGQRHVQLLDAGCGPGIHMERFREAGFECYGIDRSKEMLSIAIRELSRIKPLNAAPKVKLQMRDGFALRHFGKNSFDAVWFSALMVHLPRRFARAVINDIFRILRPGGVLYISAQAGGDAVLRRDGRFFVYYNREELERAFKQAGFRLIKFWDDRTHKGTCGDRRTKFWLNYFLTK